jgi:hypothetical protein
MDRVEHLTELILREAKKVFIWRWKEGWVSIDFSQGTQPHTERRTGLRSTDVCPISYQH